MQNLFEFPFEATSKKSWQHQSFQQHKIFILYVLQSANEDYDLIYCICAYILFILHLCNQEKKSFHDLLPAKSLTRPFRPIENSQLIKG